MKKSASKIPNSLSPAAKVWWEKIMNEFAIEDAAGLLLLESAMQAFDRKNQASDLIDKYGAVTEDRFGQLRPNPATTIERDSRAAMNAALKALNLDLVALHDSVGRPAGR